MPTPTIEKLLILQDRDQKRLSQEHQLSAIPRDVATVEQKIAGEQIAVEAARGELQQLELKKKSLENDIRATGEQMGRYRSQQIQVRKNDEFQALGVEIERAQTAIGALEEQELEVMYAIDAAKKKLSAAGEELKRNVSGHQARIHLLRERETGLHAELQEAQAQVASARVGLDESVLRLYDRLADKPGLPVVVSVHDGKCGGCHLKISSNVESESRKVDKVVTCDQCGRIVYWEA
jgi:predicted  nucleic acid-binding Zn-ribbon protein